MTLRSRSMLVLILVAAAMTTGCKSSPLKNRFAALTTDPLGRSSENMEAGIQMASTDPTMTESQNAMQAAGHVDSQGVTPVSLNRQVNSLPTMRTLAAGEDFGATLQSAQGTVLVDFYADWCGPCKTQGKVLHDLEGYAAERGAQIIKVNVDEHRTLARKYKVASLPTLLVVKNGEVVDRQMGLKRAAQIREMLR